MRWAIPLLVMLLIPVLGNPQDGKPAETTPVPPATSFAVVELFTSEG